MRYINASVLLLLSMAWTGCSESGQLATGDAGSQTDQLSNQDISPSETSLSTDAASGDQAEPADQAVPSGDASDSDLSQPDASSPATGQAMLGVYVGNDPQAVLDFEAWLGCEVDGVLGYTGNADWADYDGSVGWAASLWSAIDRRVLWSVPLIPWGATLDEAATGAYNDHYLQAAQTLAQYRPQEPVLYIRTAWEFNGDWFPWAVTSKAQIPAFIGAWKQFVDTFRSVSNRFRFDWCPSIGTNPYPFEDAYPGDNYVDVIGLDTYDETIWCGIQDPEARWQHLLTRDHGLDWFASFAQAHNKPISVAEWGVGGNGSGDNPVFIQRMTQWVANHNVVYQTYWDSNAAYPGKLSQGQYPQAGAAYKQAFCQP